jgi:hypothetical protein
MKKILLLIALLISTSLMAQKTWTGNTNTEWTNDNNWSGGAAPNLAFNNETITIPFDVINFPTLTGDQLQAGNIVIASGARFEINGSLNHVDGAITNDGTVSLTAGSSLMSVANISGSGQFKYNRTLTVTDEFYAISAPVSGQDIDAFITAETVAQNGSNMGLGTYTTSSDSYSYIQSGASGSGNFTQGKGYIVRVSSAESILFTGDNPSTTAVNFPLDYTGSGDDARYNLVGNPWPSFLKTGGSDFLSDNSSKLTSEQIWLWDAASGAFLTRVTANGFNIAPGQAFFVQAVAGGSGNLVFDSSHRQVGIGDTFRNSVENNFEVYLNISNESIDRTAEVYYITGTTTGFDNGYDGTLFGLQNNDLAIYTAHDSDENDSEMKLSIQSVPEMSHVVPVGINAFEGTEFTISATTLNRPDGYNVYLEDRDNNTFTLLNETSDFTTTVSSNLNGTGRFYLHTTTSLLNNNETNDVVLNVFKLDRNNFITIEGLATVSNQTYLKLYNLIGKEVLSITLTNNTNTQTISTEELSTGIYVIKLESGNNLLTKKLIIK